MPYDSGGALGVGGVRGTVFSAKKAVNKAKRNKAFNESPWRQDYTGMNIAPQTKIGPQKQKVARNTVLRGKPNEGKAEQDQLEMLFQQLLNSVAASGGANVDYESALRKSEQAIRDAYATDIQAIRTGNRQARKQTARDRRELEKMYGHLAKTYRKAGKQEMRQGKNLSNRMQNNAERSANLVQDMGQDMISEQAELAKGLGIEDAMPAASEGVTKEASRTRNRIIGEGAEDGNRQLGFAGNSRRFMNRGAQTARYEGANRSADLLADLQDFLQGNRQQIASLKSQRGRELAENEQSVMASVAEMQQAADSETWDRLMQLAGLKRDMENDEFEQATTLQELQMKMAGEDNSMPGLENVQNAQAYINQANRPKLVANSLEELLSRPAMRHGSYYDKQSRSDEKMTVYQARELAKQVAAQNGLGPRETQLLMLAIEARMG